MASDNLELGLCDAYTLSNELNLFLEVSGVVAEVMRMGVSLFMRVEAKLTIEEKDTLKEALFVRELRVH